MTTVGNISAEQLKQFIERVERLTEEKSAIQDGIKAVYAEAKANGFDVTAMKEIIKIRTKDQSEIQEEEYILDTYKRALGMVPELDD